MANPSRDGTDRKAGRIAQAWGWVARAWILGTALTVLLPTAGAVAAERQFMGYAIEPMAAVLEVVRDVNIRSGPTTETERMGQATKGTELEAVGRAKGDWIAVRRGGKDLGFVFESFLKVVSRPPLERDQAGHILGVDDKPLAPASGRFLAVTDIVARAKPTSRAPNRDKLERGTQVDALAASDDGKWLAVRWSDREMGFVPRRSLLLLIDGELRESVEGVAKLKNGTCHFSIRFSGRSQVEGDIIDTADYDVDWRCNLDGRRLEFPGFMFITEAPFQLTDNQVYQISTDLLDVAREYDEAFSTVFLYRRGEEKVLFDGVSMKELGAEPTVRELPARSVRDALVAAASMAPAAWNGDLWSFLGENTE